MHSVEEPQKLERMRRLFSRAYSRAALPYPTVGLLVVVVIVAGGREIEHHINAVESWITGLGPWGVLAFIGLFALTTSLLPDTVMVVVSRMVHNAIRPWRRLKKEGPE